MSRSVLGYTAPDLYTDNSDIIPNVQPGYGGAGYASIYLRGGTYPTTNGPQQIYVVNENITKMFGTHIFKAGVYFAHQQFGQLTQGNDNSTIITGDYYGSYNTGNSFADLLTGQIAGYQQSTNNFVANLREKRTDFFVEDQWKAIPRLSINFGVRVNHIGAWYELAAAWLCLILRCMIRMAPSLMLPGWLLMPRIPVFRSAADTRLDSRWRPPEALPAAKALPCCAVALA